MVVCEIDVLDVELPFHVEHVVEAAHDPPFDDPLDCDAQTPGLCRILKRLLMQFLDEYSTP